jgi:hypothetical protein
MWASLVSRSKFSDLASGESIKAVDRRRGETAKQINHRGGAEPLAGRPMVRNLKSALIGAGAGLAVTAFGLDTAVSMSTYGLYLGYYGPYLVIAGIPAFLNLVFATFLMRGNERRVMRYSMILVGMASAFLLGYYLFLGIYQGLLGGL